MTSIVRSCLRRVVVRLLLLGALGRMGIAQDGAAKEGPRPNMVGAYGPWLSEKVLGDGPARLSFRTGRWKSLDEWRAAARERAWERIAPVDQGGKPEVRVESTQEFDGLHIERLSWQLPGGPADRGGLPEAGRGQGAVARDPGAPRSRREQVPGLAQDRPDRRRADGDRRRPPGRVLRGRRLGQRDRQARLRRPGPRHVPVREPSRPRGRRLPASARTGSTRSRTTRRA